MSASSITAVESSSSPSGCMAKKEGELGGGSVEVPFPINRVEVQSVERDPTASRSAMPVYVDAFQRY